MDNLNGFKDSLKYVCGAATYTYMKNRKAGMTIVQSFKKLTLLYLLLEIPMGICYYWAINLRM